MYLGFVLVARRFDQPVAPRRYRLRPRGDPNPAGTAGSGRLRFTDVQRRRLASNYKTLCRRVLRHMPPSAREFLEDSRNAVAARFDDMTGPSAAHLAPGDAQLSGHRPSQEAKCASVWQRVISNPASLMTVSATSTSMPSICVRSTPVMRWSSCPKSNWGVWLPAFRRRFTRTRAPGGAGAGDWEAGGVSGGSRLETRVAKPGEPVNFRPFPQWLFAQFILFLRSIWILI
jgi:hypothetical protein